MEGGRGSTDSHGLVFPWGCERRGGHRDPRAGWAGHGPALPQPRGGSRVWVPRAGICPTLTVLFPSPGMAAGSGCPGVASAPSRPCSPPAQRCPAGSGSPGMASAPLTLLFPSPEVPSRVWAPRGGGSCPTLTLPLPSARFLHVQSSLHEPAAPCTHLLRLRPHRAAHRPHPAL